MSSGSFSREGGNEPDVDQSRRAKCFWFFLPLPQPLGLPAGWVLEFLRDPLEAALALNGSAPAASLVIRQVQRTANVLVSDNLDVTQAALRAADPMVRSADWADDPEVVAAIHASNEGTITVAEVAVPVPTGADDELDDALERALEIARHVQNSVAVVLQRGIRLVTKATLPPIINVMRGSINLDGGPPSLDELIQYGIPGAPPSVFGVTPGPLTDDQLEGVRRSLDQLARGSMLSAYVDVRRDAMIQRDLEHNTRLMISTLATAAEVLLDSFLLHMLWEEHTSAADAASVFDRSTRHQTRVLTHFPPRWRGEWDPNGRGPVGRYFRDLVWTRNRVVHTGAVPTEEEAEAAMQALYELEHFCGDRLCAPGVLSRYTRTAMAFLGERGIRQRNAWTRRVEALTREPSEPAWINAFARFRHVVNQRLRGAHRPSGGMVDDLVLYVLVARDDTTRFVLHDTATLEAASVADASELVPTEVAAQLVAVTQWLTVQPPHERDDPIVIRVADFQPQRAPIALEWRSEEDFFPELRMYPGTATQPPA